MLSKYQSIHVELIWARLKMSASSQPSSKDEAMRNKFGGSKGCYGYQPGWGVGDGVVAAATSSSAIKVSWTNRPTYQKPPSPSPSGQQDTRLVGQQGHRSHATQVFEWMENDMQLLDTKTNRWFGLYLLRPTECLRETVCGHEGCKLLKLLKQKRKLYSTERIHTHTCVS